MKSMTTSYFPRYRNTVASATISLLSIGMAVGCISDQSGVKVKPNRNEWGEVVEMRATLSSPQAKDPVGTILYDADTVNLGEVPARSFITQELGFRIGGDGPVVLLSCRSSCGCTVPKCPKEIYHPGDHGRFPIKFRSTNQPPGDFHKEITIHALGVPSKKRIIVVGTVLPEK